MAATSSDRLMTTVRICRDAAVGGAARTAYIWSQAVACDQITCHGASAANLR